jgi:predicted RecA/RadA family phage recombinase
MAEATFVQCDDMLDYTPSSAARAGAVILLAIGLAGIVGSGLDANTLGAVHTEGLFDIAAASGTVFTDGEVVYWDNVNKLAVNSGAATASFRLGSAFGGKINGSTTVRTLLNSSPSPAIRSVSVADSAAVSNTVTETVIGTYTIPAGMLVQGRVLEFLAAAIATATNSTDTFRFRVRLGDITGTVIADSTAVDLANGDASVQMGVVVVREDGLIGTGLFTAAAQSILKTTSNPTVVQATAIDTTVAQVLVFTCQESVASAGNSAKATAFNVYVR